MMSEEEKEKKKKKKESWQWRILIDISDWASLSVLSVAHDTKRKAVSDLNSGDRFLLLIIVIMYVPRENSQQVKMAPERMNNENVSKIIILIIETLEDIIPMPIYY